MSSTTTHHVVYKFYENYHRNRVCSTRFAIRHGRGLPRDHLFHSIWHSRSSQKNFLQNSTCNFDLSEGDNVAPIVMIITTLIEDPQIVLITLHELFGHCAFRQEENNCILETPSHSCEISSIWAKWFRKSSLKIFLCNSMLTCGPKGGAIYAPGSKRYFWQRSSANVNKFIHVNQIRKPRPCGFRQKK